ncbi:hypothetical protein [Thermococcus thioreducens]|uniref:Uncharacterized protein n=1 Tax=Thermococcus thioreducens TaxID=277988 RepID=A0A0Q2S3R6_9EURY|nr:hypothetical protein [Thermococcus thioreducens]ASJ11789.1 hypothetical protein A3L14_02290 [Thermococcus thioreducens]KQH82123.1 hypothetical protein AMR53_07225 [Thermococcus thioreducens]SEW13788.1 hypothetical protein SAMN05216170_1822 [Thermococcus thioreducens]
MDELEFCIKSLSYPLGMLLEGLERREGEKVEVKEGLITLPRAPFAALCYLTGIALFDALDIVDKKRLGDDYGAIEGFCKKLLNSKLGARLKPYLESPGRYISPGEGLSIDWLEFEKREEKVRPHLKRLMELRERTCDRSEFLAKTDFLAELSVDEALLVSYLSGEAGLRELVNAALGKHNSEFRDAVKEYFKALRG